MRLLLPIAALFLLSSCALADLTEGYASSSQQDPQKLLQQVAKAHGVSSWSAVNSYQVSLEDEFYGFFGKNGNPFPNNEAQLKLEYLPGTFTGRATFLEGKWKDRVWGIHQWKTYHKNTPTEAIRVKQDKDILFWVPTYQYFIEFPARIQEATYFEYLGTKSLAGTDHHVVLASWGKGTPQKEIDQYLIYVHPETHRIGRLEYTVREVYGFISGAVTFNDYLEKDGILFPTDMPVESNLVKEGLLHTMRIMDVSLNHIPAEQLIPAEVAELDPGQKPN